MAKFNAETLRGIVASTEEVSRNIAKQERSKDIVSDLVSRLLDITGDKFFNSVNKKTNPITFEDYAVLSLLANIAKYSDITLEGELSIKYTTTDYPKYIEGISYEGALVLYTTDVELTVLATTAQVGDTITMFYTQAGGSELTNVNVVEVSEELEGDVGADSHIFNVISYFCQETYNLSPYDTMEGAVSQLQEEDFVETTENHFDGVVEDGDDDFVETTENHFDGVVEDDDDDDDEGFIETTEEYFDGVSIEDSSPRSH